MAVNENDRSWLVKAGERILGPFKAEEVKGLLASRELVALDEIASPGKRWRYVREEPSFAKALEELRKWHLNQREDTELGTEISEPVSEQTETEVSALPPALPTPEVSSLSASAPAPVEAQGGYRLAVRTPPPPSRLETQVQRQAHGQAELRPTAEGRADAGVRLSIRRTSGFVWALMGVLVLGGAFVFFRQPGRSSGSTAGEASQNFAESARRGLEAFRLGRFEEALRRLSDADAAKPGDPEVSTKYALLLARADQTQLAKRKVEPFLNSTDPAIRRQARIADAVALLAEGAETTARRDLQDALKADPASSVVLADLGSLALGQRDWPVAISRLREARTVDPESAPLQVLLAQALWQSGRTGAREAGEIMQASVSRTSDFRQEASVILAGREQAAGNRPDSRAHLIAAIVSDPFDTDYHWHDPGLFLAPVAWASALLPTCKTLAAENPGDVAGHALLVICEQKAGHFTEASAAAADLILRSPEDPFSHAAAAYVALAQKDDATAEAALKIALDKAEARHDGAAAQLARTLKGHLCWRRGDMKCVQLFFGMTSSVAPASAFAQTLLARVQLKEGKPRAVITASVEAVTRASPNFIPLLELQADMEKIP